MKRLWSSLLLAALWLGCPAPMSNAPPDDTPDEPEPYDGPTGNSTIPHFETDNLDAGDPVIDAGEIIVDTRCCPTTFFITDGREPSDATGLLKGSSSFFGDGLALTRTDAGWTTSGCFPIESSASYWYAFKWNGELVDGGVMSDRDGGEETVLVQLTETRERASDVEPRIDTADGQRNFYHSVNSCDGLDGGVP